MELSLSERAGVAVVMVERQLGAAPAPEPSRPSCFMMRRYLWGAGKQGRARGGEHGKEATAERPLWGGGG